MTIEPLVGQKEAARMLGVSVAYLRRSDCPKVLLPGNGPGGNPLARYLALRNRTAVPANSPAKPPRRFLKGHHHPGRAA